MNSVALIGRLTADPTMHAGEKHASATFRLAVPKPGTDGADFVDIVTFDKLAGVCADWLTKGREVAVVGKLRLSEWTDRNGEKRSRIQVVADAVSSSASPPRPVPRMVVPPSPTTSRRTVPPSASTATPADPTGAATPLHPQRNQRFRGGPEMGVAAPPLPKGVVP